MDLTWTEKCVGFFNKVSLLLFSLYYMSTLNYEINVNQYYIMNFPLSTRPHPNVVWYNNSWSDFLNILNYVPKEREKYTAKK